MLYQGGQTLSKNGSHCFVLYGQPFIRSAAPDQLLSQTLYPQRSADHWEAKFRKRVVFIRQPLELCSLGVQTVSRSEDPFFFFLQWKLVFCKTFKMTPIIVKYLCVTGQPERQGSECMRKPILTSWSSKVKSLDINNPLLIRSKQYFMHY